MALATCLIVASGAAPGQPERPHSTTTDRASAPQTVMIAATDRAIIDASSGI
jgi:hypothetical protein